MSRTARIYNRWLTVDVESVSKTLSSHHTQVMRTSCLTDILNGLNVTLLNILNDILHATTVILIKKLKVNS